MEEKSPNCSWSAFHANRDRPGIRYASLDALLPLFHEKSTLPGMIKHGMNLVHEATSYLNSNQTPVLCVDQPLYAICKTIQWIYMESTNLSL